MYVFFRFPLRGAINYLGQAFRIGSGGCPRQVQQTGLPAGPSSAADGVNLKGQRLKNEYFLVKTLRARPYFAKHKQSGVRNV